MSGLKIALVTQQYAPFFEGGTEVVVRAQARELAELGHQVHIVSGCDLAHAGQDLLEHRIDGLRVVHLPRKSEEGLSLTLERPRLEALLQQACAGTDLVHLHHWSTLSSSLVRMFAKQRPVAVTLHDYFSTCARSFRHSPVEGLECPERGEFSPCVHCLTREAPELPLDFFWQGLQQRARNFEAELSAAQVIYAPSEFLAKAISRLFDARALATLEVLPHGLSRELSPTAAPRPYGGPSGSSRRPLRVLHFGHRSELKGTLDLVRALAALPAGTVELRLAGAQVEPGFDERLRYAAGSLAVRFAGAYALESLPELAAGMDLAAFPSRAHESYGLVVDEALALGLPVWVSDRGALHERVGQAGRVLPAAAPEAWSAAFLEIQRRPELLAAQRAAVPAERNTAAGAARILDRRYRALVTPHSP